MSLHLYQRWGGRLTAPRECATSRFWRYVELEDVIEDGCWRWRGSRNQHGYAQFKADKKLIRAHRFAYELMVGPIPEGMTIDHMCHDSAECDGGLCCPHRSCVNPAHMEIATRGENARRAMTGTRQWYCKRGHLLDYSSGRSMCHICRAAAMSGQLRAEREAAS